MGKVMYAVGSSEKGPIKIGVTAMLIQHRINNLQPGHPRKLRSFGTWPASPTSQHDHSRCCFSTNLAEQITAGRGKLSWDGEWEFPCEECAERVNAKYGRSA